MCLGQGGEAVALFQFRNNVFSFYPYLVGALSNGGGRLEVCVLDGFS